MLFPWCLRCLTRPTSRLYPLSSYWQNGRISFRPLERWDPVDSLLPNTYEIRTMLMTRDRGRMHVTWLKGPMRAFQLSILSLRAWTRKWKYYCCGNGNGGDFWARACWHQPSLTLQCSLLAPGETKYSYTEAEMNTDDYQEVFLEDDIISTFDSKNCVNYHGRDLVGDRYIIVSTQRKSCRC